jgi:hypothetical protein
MISRIEIQINVSCTSPLDTSITIGIMPLTAGQHRRIRRRITRLVELTHNHIFLVETILLPIAHNALEPSSVTLTNLRVTPNDSTEVPEDPESEHRIKIMQQAQMLIDPFQYQKIYMYAIEVIVNNWAEDWVGSYAQILDRLRDTRLRLVTLCQNYCREIYDPLIQFMDPQSTVKEDEEVLRGCLDDDLSNANRFLERVRVWKSELVASEDEGNAENQ